MSKAKSIIFIIAAAMVHFGLTFALILQRISCDIQPHCISLANEIGEGPKKGPEVVKQAQKGAKKGPEVVKPVTSGDFYLTTSGPFFANNDVVDTNGNPLRDEPADILVHELVGHAIPRITGPKTGNAVKDENKVRQEEPGSMLRLPDPNHRE